MLLLQLRLHLGPKSKCPATKRSFFMRFVIYLKKKAAVKGRQTPTQEKGEIHYGTNTTTNPAHLQYD